jgi:hypothetical protein
MPREKGGRGDHAGPSAHVESATPFGDGCCGGSEEKGMRGLSLLPRHWAAVRRCAAGCTPGSVDDIECCGHHPSVCCLLTLLPLPLAHAGLPADLLSSSVARSVGDVRECRFRRSSPSPIA